MKKHKHTPGPWSTKKAAEGNVEVIGPKGECLADSWCFDLEFVDEADHNGKLMAASVDLLNDLIDAAAQLRKYEALHRAKGTPDSLAKAEVNADLALRFEQTIAKATA